MLHQAVTDLVPETDDSASGWRHLEHLEHSTFDLADVMQAWKSNWQSLTGIQGRRTQSTESKLHMQDVFWKGRA
jgi:hypothetical protein